MLSEAQKALIGLVTLALIGLGIYAWGLWQHHQGYQQHVAEVAAELQQKEKEWTDAIEQNNVQAAADKAFIADYYYYAGQRRVLPTGHKLQPCRCAPHDPGGVLPAASGSVPLEEYLQCAEDSAQDAARLVRVRQWGERIGLKAE